MYGANMGTLKLNLNGKYRRNTILFTASGNKGNKWRIATIDVNLLGRYKVREITMATVRCLVVTMSPAAHSWLDSSVGIEHCTGIANVIGSSPVEA